MIYFASTYARNGKHLNVFGKITIYVMIMLNSLVFSAYRSLLAFLTLVIQPYGSKIEIAVITTRTIDISTKAIYN